MPILLFMQNVLPSTLSYGNKTTKDCIQFLNKKMLIWNLKLQIDQIRLNYSKT